MEAHDGHVAPAARRHRAYRRGARRRAPATAAPTAAAPTPSSELSADGMPPFRS